MDRRRLIADIQQETGVQLQADDPILMAALINERVLGQALARVEEATAAAGDQLAATFVQAEQSAKVAASGIITNAGQWVGDQVREVMREAGAALLAEMRTEAVKAEVARREAVRAAWAAGGAAVVAMAALVGAVVAI